MADYMAATVWLRANGWGSMQVDSDTASQRWVAFPPGAVQRSVATEALACSATRQTLAGAYRRVGSNKELGHYVAWGSLHWHSKLCM